MTRNIHKPSTSARVTPTSTMFTGRWMCRSSPPSRPDTPTHPTPASPEATGGVRAGSAHGKRAGHRQ